MRNYKYAPLTAAEKKEIVESYMRLNNQMLVAKETRHSPNTVSKVLKENGLAKGIGGNQKYKVTDSDLAEACKTMTLNEIAEKYGMHPYSIPRRCKKIGVYPVGYSIGGNTEAANRYWEEHPNEPRGCIADKRAVYGECWHFVETQKRWMEEKHPGFEYLESRRKGAAYRIRLKCRICGTVVERAYSTVRQTGILCETCEDRRKLSNTQQNLLGVFLAIAETKKPKKCAMCGGVFYSAYSSQKYCSAKCKRKKRQPNIRKRCRKYGVFYDPTITRSAVIERDNCICQICGKPCDPNDTSWGYFGAYAPTVDHIIALKNGGTHTWDNVQCAHAICNSYKRDLKEYDNAGGERWVY